MSPPKFLWPQDQKPEPTPEAVVTTVKHIINSVKTQIDSDTTTPKGISDSSTIIQATIENNSTEQNILTTIADTITSTARNIVNTMSNITESATPSIATGNSFVLTDSSSSNSTGFATNNNSTVLTEMVGGNNTIDENGSTIDSMLETVTTEASIATETIKDIITTTTRNVIHITNDTTDMILMNQTDTNQSPDMYNDDSLLVYVILGVLLGILILIFIALLIIYRKYKKCRLASGDYCVTQLKEIPSSSSIKTTSDLEHAHVKH